MDQVTLPRVTVQQALHVATAAGYPVALIAALKAALEQPEQADWTHLKRYGYAPGDYMSMCCRCGESVSGLDKGAVTCKPCAEARHSFEQAAALEQPEQEPDRWGAGYEAGYAAGMAEMKQEQAEPVAWIDKSGHPKHRMYRQSATERRLYGPLRPLYAAPISTTTTQQEQK